MEIPRAQNKRKAKWLEQVIEGLNTIKVNYWRTKVQNRKLWRKIVQANRNLQIRTVKGTNPPQ